MKKEQVKVGSVYTVKVSGGVVPVRITAEKWTGDKHVGWTGVNTKTNRAVRVKSAQRLRAEVGGANAPTAPVAPVGETKAKPAAQKKAPPATAAKAARPPKPAKEPKTKKVSGLDAAAMVLAKSAKPLGAKEMVEQAEAKGLWTSPGGKTPAATVYAAIIREIAAKGKDARFKKVERGLFVAQAAGKGA